MPSPKTCKVSGLVYSARTPTARSASATRPATKAPTANVLAQCRKFQQAAFYGRAAQQGPAFKAAYETGLDAYTTSAYTVAVTDFLNAPDITNVYFAAYRGQPGYKITITATDRPGTATTEQRTI